MHDTTHNNRETEDLWFMNSRVIVRRSAAAASDGVSIIEHHDAYGDSPPLHIHRDEDEIFHVFEGHLRFRVGERELAAGPGDTLVAPKGVPHSFRVESPVGARYLTIVTGPGFETLIRAVSRRAIAPTLPTPIAPTPQAIEALTRAASRAGIDIVGPSLG